MFKVVYSVPVYNYIQEMKAVIAKHPELDFEKESSISELTRSELMEKMWQRVHRMMQIKPEVFLNNSKNEVPFKWGFNFTSTPGVVHLH